MKQEKLVLAYSGGLDTSYSLKKLSQENNKIKFQFYVGS